MEEKKLFYEPMSRRYFESTMNNVIQAESNMNKKLVNTGEVRLNDFYSYIGIDETDMGDVFGWSLHNGECFCNYLWIDFENKLTILEDGLECYVRK